MAITPTPSTGSLQPWQRLSFQTGDPGTSRGLYAQKAMRREPRAGPKCEADPSAMFAGANSGLIKSGLSGSSHCNRYIFSDLSDCQGPACIKRGEKDAEG